MQKNPEKSPKTVLVSAVFLVNADGEVLLAQRPEGKSMAGLWEFPGGKVDAGETLEEALVREIQEELGILLDEGDLEHLITIKHAYPDFHLEMPMFLSTSWLGNLQPMEGQTLAWVKPENLADYPMPPADEPLIRELPRLLKNA